jgi:hypothetical protein
VPLSVTVAVPTVVPPVLQSVGALDCGPNTSNVTVPDGDEPPDRSVEIESAEIAESTDPVPGAPTGDSVGDAAPTLVSVIDPLQPESDGSLLESPE